MKVKIDTKEKMHVITVKELKLPANMTEGIQELLLNFLSDTIKNIIVNFEEVNEIELMPARALLSIQQKFYEDNHSMVFCNLKPAVTDFLDKMDLLETMNITPTESEAWDIVQMEEIERELLES
ncbi:MAG: STAS domain-containing protein [Ginsengibacter sp.]